MGLLQYHHVATFKENNMPEEIIQIQEGNFCRATPRTLHLHLLTTFTYIIVHMCMSRKHMLWVGSIGVVRNTQCLRYSWASPNDLRHNWASFSTILTHSICLWVPRSPDLVIFVLTTDDRQIDKTDCFTPCSACTHGIKTRKGRWQVLLSS